MKRKEVQWSFVPSSTVVRCWICNTAASTKGSLVVIRRVGYFDPTLKRLLAI
jgi:hypothetical protein